MYISARTLAQIVSFHLRCTSAHPHPQSNHAHAHKPATIQTRFPVICARMQADFAIIGGTGIGPRLEKMDAKPVTLENRFGAVQGSIMHHQGTDILLVQRHSAGHKTPPHKVNYRAIAQAVKDAGCRGCIASAAVGSLRKELPVGSIVICSDFLDFTGRNITMFEDEVVHTDMSESMPLSGALVLAARDLGVDVREYGIYATTNGPRYETPAEIRMLQVCGANLAGMTAGTEAILFSELGVPYGCVAVVTNLATGIGEDKLQHGEVVDVMEREGKKVVDLLLGACRSLAGQTGPAQHL